MTHALFTTDNRHRHFFTPLSWLTRRDGNSSQRRRLARGEDRKRRDKRLSRAQADSAFYRMWAEKY